MSRHHVLLSVSCPVCGRRQVVTYTEVGPYVAEVVTCERCDRPDPEPDPTWEFWWLEAA